MTVFGPVMVLDFSGDLELWKKMGESEVSPDDVIGLLEMLFDNRLCENRRRHAG